MAAHTRLLLLLLAVASPAGADVLSFDGRLVAVLPGLGEAEIASGPGVARVDGVQLGEVEILQAAVYGEAALPVTDPNAAPVTSLRVGATLPPGRLGIDPQAPPFGEPAITGSFPLPGWVQVCMLIGPLPPCVGGFSFPLTRGGTLGAGVGGLLTVGMSASLRLSVWGAPFTLNTVWVTGETSNGATFTLTSSGTILGPALFTSSAGQTGGFLSLVTPLRVRSGGVDAPSNAIPGFLRMEIAFVPEPGLLLLLTAGAGSLLLLERHRNRSRSPQGDRS